MTDKIEKSTGGSALEGVLLSVACQAAALFGFGAVGDVLKLSWLGLFWGISQWCVVVPLLRSLKRKQKDRTAQALLITSYAGIAFNAVFLLMAYQSIEHPGY